MVNRGSPNPSSLVVNLAEAIRQVDPTKLHVTTHNKEDDAGGDATYNQTAINGNSTGVIASKTVALSKLFHLSGIKVGGEADGKFTLRIAGQNKLTRRNSAAEPTVGQQFQPPDQGHGEPGHRDPRREPEHARVSVRGEHPRVGRESRVTHRYPRIALRKCRDA